MGLAALWRPATRTWVALGTALLLALAVPAAEAARPAWVRELQAIAQDDPRDAIARAGAREREATDIGDRFWAQLALARAHGAFDAYDDAAASLHRAEATLAAWPAATDLHRLWAALVRLDTTWTHIEPALAQRGMGRLKDGLARLRPPDGALECEARSVDLTLLIDIDSLDEAWLAAEALERCARQLRLPELEAYGSYSLGLIASRGKARTQADPDEHFARALRVLGDQPYRLFRTTLLKERGVALRNVKRWEEALAHLTASADLARAIDFAPGLAGANISTAVLHVTRNEPARALPLLNEARRLLEGHDDGFRLLYVGRYTVAALAALKRPEVVQAIDFARRWDSASVPPNERALLARALAAGYASVGRYAEAFHEVERAERLQEDGQAMAADVQVLRLQARYAAAQRDAENSELRHRSEQARLALETQAAKQRALWAAIATLAVLLAVVGGLVVRMLRRRRQLADLALRDELTGQPNRRAIRAYAEASFAQARQLGLPLTLALIDLDHFKRVNDTLGHAGGDAVLRALALAAREVLRGQDRFGRWGGEEWLLVMPGTGVAEMPAVFERLRERFANTAAAGVAGRHGSTFSMGAAALAPQTATLDALIAACDEQLYTAKTDGRDRLAFVTA